MDTFAFVEHGGMDLMMLTGRTAKQFARIEDSVLLNKEAAAELAQAIIHIRQKYSEPINGHEEPIPAIARTKPALGSGKPAASSNEVYDWLLEHGPATKKEIQKRFKFANQKLHNRIWYLKNQAHSVIENADGLLEALPDVYEPEPEPEPEPRLGSKVWREAFLAFIAESPGQPAKVIRERLGIGEHDWHALTTYLRKNKLAHVKADGGYYIGEGEPLTTLERSNIARLQHARDFTPISEEAISAQS